MLAINTTARISATLFTILVALSAASADDIWLSFETRTQASLRGLAAVSKEVAWACGSQGSVIQTIDGGKLTFRRTTKGDEVSTIESEDSGNVFAIGKVE